MHSSDRNGSGALRVLPPPPPSLISLAPFPLAPFALRRYTVLPGCCKHG